MQALLNTALVVVMVGASSVLLFGVNFLLAEGAQAVFSKKPSASAVQDAANSTQWSPVEGGSTAAPSVSDKP